MKRIVIFELEAALKNLKMHLFQLIIDLRGER